MMWTITLLEECLLSELSNVGTPTKSTLSTDNTTCIGRLGSITMLGVGGFEGEGVWSWLPTGVVVLMLPDSRDRRGRGEMVSVDHDISFTHDYCIFLLSV